LDRDFFGHLNDVGDDADFAALRLETHEGVEGGVQGLGVETAKTFVYEERFDAQAAGGKGGEAEGERERNEKGFAAREGVDGAAFATHVVVEDFEAEGARMAFEVVTVGEGGELGVGLAKEDVEGVLLGEVAKLFAVGGTNEVAEVCPRGGGGLGGVDVGGEGGGAGAFVVVGLEVGAVVGGGFAGGGAGGGEVREEGGDGGGGNGTVNGAHSTC
jgi:hypothetical protein